MRCRVLAALCQQFGQADPRDQIVGVGLEILLPERDGFGLARFMVASRTPRLWRASMQRGVFGEGVLV